MFRIASDHTLDPLMKAEHPVPYLLRRQDLPRIYYYNCVLDFTLPRTIYAKQSMTGDRIYPLILPAEDVIDIDTPKDLQFCELFLKDKT
jgi:CMP-N-acetylneuraminic acid synthetase